MLFGLVALGLCARAQSAPVISSAATAQGQLSATFSYQITATNSPTSFNATGLPSGLSINTATGVISGTPTSALSYQIVISATNSSGTGTAPLVLSIYAGAPVVTSAATASAVNGNGFTYQVTATGAPTGFSASNLPPGLGIDTVYGDINGTPTSTGTYAVVIGVTNDTGTTNFTLTITVAPAVPTFNAIMTAAGVVGQFFSYGLSASNNPTSFSATGLPTGLTLNTSTGVISGTVNSAGTTIATISATNSLGTGSATFSLTFTATQENSVPYTQDFEGYSVGALPNGYGWTVTAGSVSVTNIAAYSGSQSLVANAGSTAGTVVMSMAPYTGEQIEFFDFYAIPSAEASTSQATTFTVEGAKFCYTSSNGTGTLQVYNGNGSGSGTWVPTASTTPLTGTLATTWIRLTVRLNFTTHTWDMYVNGAMVAYDEGFISNTCATNLIIGTL